MGSAATAAETDRSRAGSANLTNLIGLLLPDRASPPDRRCSLEGRSVEKVQPSIDFELDPADHPGHQVEKERPERPSDHANDRVEDRAQDDGAEAEEHPEGARAPLAGREPGKGPD